ncbi:MAG: ribosome assembly cofactor RimP [Candidatus Cryptobacteroides sp.]
MNVSDIIDAIGAEIVARNCFIVGVSVSADNDVEIIIESEDAEIELDDCVEISRVFESRFDRNVEDYSITVSSAGLDQPFKVFRQYEKAVGSLVEVGLKGGRKLLATLTAATEEAISLNYSVLEAVEGKKKKEKVEHNDTFPMTEVNFVKPHIEFE